jgi:arylsulfatase
VIDVVGIGATIAFGGRYQPPTFEKLAANGIKYSRIHTTAK